LKEAIMPGTRQPISRNLELEALRQAVRWPKPSPRVALALAGQLLAARQYDQGCALFAERAEAAPDQSLYAALTGFFQARAGHDLDHALDLLDRAVDQAPGVTNYFRGLILAQLPAAVGKAEAAVADLELVLALPERAGLPVGLRRAVYPALATAYAALGRTEDAQAARRRTGPAPADPDFPALVTDWWVTRDEGFHFGPPRLVEFAPGVHVAQGFDFADIAAVKTGEGIVLVDTTTSRAHLRAALAELRTRTTAPITRVILTHAHTDHIGGLDEVRTPGVEVIAQAHFAEELRLQHVSPPIPFRPADPSEAGRWLDIVPDRLVRAPEKLTIGGVDFELYPITGGETSDGLVVHLPDRGVAIVGDMLMPQLGGPFFPEGSAEGLLEAMTLVEGLAPRVVIHGHTPLTDLFTIDVFPALAAALKDLHQRTLEAIRDGVPLAELLARNYLPVGLRDHPDAVLPYLVMRDNLIKRVHHQRTGYWKVDGEGIEVFTAAEWSGALDLLGGSTALAFASAGEDLLDRGDVALALRLVEYGLLRHTDDQALQGLRRRVLYRLLERYQQLSPFKFAIYAATADVEVPPAP
jgi:glyoxylase-like metal-dependent hydrolase (beta-lactamase superfamily II)